MPNSPFSQRTRSIPPRPVDRPFHTYLLPSSSSTQETNIMRGSRHDSCAVVVGKKHGRKKKHIVRANGKPGTETKVTGPIRPPALLSNGGRQNVGVGTPPCYETPNPLIHRRSRLSQHVRTPTSILLSRQTSYRKGLLYLVQASTFNFLSPLVQRRDGLRQRHQSIITPTSSGTALIPSCR